jgi:hypothetical protein
LVQSATCVSGSIMINRSFLIVIKTVNNQATAEFND